MTESSGTDKATYQVLARKYRPQNFDDLIGQEPMVVTLTNAFKTGRIAQAYMLTGVRGVGKTTTARILAKALNYEREGIDAPVIDVSEEGEHCRAIIEGRHVDVIEMDAASHTGIDDIRDIIESVQYAPAIARYKVYIIDEVHMLSRNAFNGLLKTLEEPPAHLKFIFATTEIRKVPVTVLSRCQRFDLRRIDTSLLSEHLAGIAEKESVEIDVDARALIARAAEGSVRDALSIMDQAIAHGAGKVEASAVRSMLGLADRARIIDLFEQVMSGDITAALGEIKDQYDTGADPAVVMSDLADFIHFVTRIKYVPAAAEDVSLPQSERERGAKFASELSVRVLARAWQILVKGIEEIQRSERPLAAADMVLVRLTHASSLPAPDDLIKQLEGASGKGQATGKPASNGSAPSASGLNAGNVSPPSPASPQNSAAGDPRGSATKMQISSGAGSNIASRPVEAPDTSPQEKPVLTLNSFDELIYLAEDKRDLKIRTLLRKNVRLVNFSDGRMEINLAGNPPPDFVSELGKKLNAWTGKRWTLTVSREGGEPSIEEREIAEAGERQDAARSDPAVDALLKQFPGARIIDVRVREDEPAISDEQEDDEDRLD
ncbi:MAG: DNA polymerase III subunit gamma/tau [Rhizobiaceae bacterium]